RQHHAPPPLRPVGGVAGAGGGGADVHLPARRCRRARHQGRAAGGRFRALLRQARGAAPSEVPPPPTPPPPPGGGGKPNGGGGKGRAERGPPGGPTRARNAWCAAPP